MVENMACNNIFSQSKYNNCSDISKNSRRVFCQLIDFINSLRPVADFDSDEKADIAK